jgi:superfamily II DNA or RNA helicase
MFQLRPYQSECFDRTAIAHQECDSVLVDMATGLGKTVYFAKYASQWGRDSLFQKNGRTLVICPQIQLIAQAAQKIRKETGIMPAIEQASNWSPEHSDWSRSPFVVASKQTLTSGNGAKRYERFQDVGLVIVDEAHYAVTEIYASMLQWFRDRGAKILGVTATPKRHDKLALGQVFDDAIFSYGICDAIPDGWLVPIRVKCKQLEQLDLTDVPVKNSPIYGKDFNQKQLNEKLENPKVIYEICEAISLETRDNKTAVYCSSVNEAQAVSELLEDNYGIRSAWICSDKQRCPDKRRQESMRSFTEDRGKDAVSHLCNVGMLTTGWDFPGLECIVNARPTKSLALYTQIFGRLTRPIEHDGRPVVDWVEDCAEARKEAILRSRKPYGRMIDLVDNSLEHKIVTATDVLGGTWRLALQNKVKEILTKSPIPLEIDEAKKLAEDELRLEEERLRKQRSAKKVYAKFRDQEVNPYGGRSASSRIRTQRIVATDKMCRYLWVLGFKDINNYDLSFGQAKRIIAQLKSGVSMAEVKRTNTLKFKNRSQLV